MDKRLASATGFEVAGLDTDVPVVAFAIHDGHGLSAGVRRCSGLDSEARRREEDPHTGSLTRAAQARVIVGRSRFEADLNRPPQRAIYRGPEEAWGLRVWKTPLPDPARRDALRGYRAFYQAAYGILADFELRFGRFLVLDLHSYNHRRDGPSGPPADPETNPEVNLGTGSLNADRWSGVVRTFLSSLASSTVRDHRLDVRENVKFRGGHFVGWVHENFPESACALAIEFKKTFMDEWTGKVEKDHLRELRRALARAADAAAAQLSVRA